MAKAVNQSIAWIGSFLISSLVFGLGLSAVFSIHPKRKTPSEHASEDESHDIHAKHDPDQNHNTKSNSAETHHGAKTHSSHGDHEKVKENEPHADHQSSKQEPATNPKDQKHGEAGEAEEQEISAAKIKSKATSHHASDPEVPEAKPHH